ncbi:MAG TPA: molybdenum cofactor biosynthesis protein MoaE [Nitrososphaerales archaeon]|nr:molybdenum cofactor biosynthesis protein MoaE [Nitrososphaerales archaeon]
MARLTRSVIDPAEVVASVADPGAGAVALFLGTVRDNSEAGSVTAMEYEAYPAMAERSIAETEEEVRRRWPDTKGVRVVHRVGRLAIGDVSVAVAVSSPHRAEAFEACRYAIERIKRDAAIWKRETLADGSAVWVEGAEIRGRRARKPKKSRTRRA